MGSVKIEVMGPHDDYLMVKKKGIVDFEQLYANIWKWYIDHGYEVQETDYKGKTASPMGTEEEFWIAGYRNEDDFNRWWIKLLISIWDSSPVMVKKDGKEKKMYKCRLRIQFDVYFEADYEKKFDKNSVLRGLRKFYIGTIIRRKVQTEGDKFEYEFHDLQDLIKKNLDMDLQGDQYAHYWKN